MGEVFLARDLLESGRAVAIKMLRPDALDSASVERFKDEYRSLTRLRHPNLVQVLDFGTSSEDGRHFLTMPYLEGRDLGSLRWPALAEAFDDLTAQCLRALDYIHARGILHHDIKPQNILIRVPFQVMLLDFGLARPMAGEEGAGLSGTLHYAAPERLDGTGPDQRSDLYSLGAVLYEALSGRPPFAQESPRQVIGAILQGGPPPLRDINPAVPERIAGFVQALLARAPEARPASAAAAMELLNQGADRPIALDTPETHASFISTGRFVGRDAELATLKGLVDDHLSARSGDVAPPRLVVVRGDGGIGKSRLLRELSHDLRVAEVPVVAGRCYEASGLPFQAFVDVLRELRSPESKLPAAAAKALDHVIPGAMRPAAAVPGVASGVTSPSTPESYDKSDLLAGVAEALDHLAAGRRGVLLLDDLHWSDSAGVELLEMLLLRAAGSPWLVIGDLRPREASAAPIGSFLDRCAGVPGLRSMTLAPLDAGQVAELVASMVPFEQPPTHLARLLHRHTAGTPLDIEEMMRSLAETGSLRREGDRFVAENRSLDAIRLPASLSSAVAQRIESLGTAERSLVELLALLDRPARFPLLASALGADVERLHEAAAGLDRLRIATLETVGDGEIQVGLAHSRIREAIERQIPAERKRALHLSVAEALEEEHAGAPDEVLDELARHFDAAGSERALDYLLRAAERASRLFNPASHRRHLERALALLPAHDAGRRLQALGELTRVLLYDLGDPEAGLRTATLLHQEARQAGDTQRQVTALLAQGWGKQSLGEHDTAGELARRGLSLARSVGDTSGISRCLGDLAAFYGGRGEHREALAHAREATGLCESQGDVPRALVNLNNVALSHLCLGEPREAATVLTDLLARARENGLEALYFRFLGNLCAARRDTGDLAGAIPVAEEALEWARAHGYLELAGHHLSALGQIAAQQGRFDAAIGMLREGLDLCAMMGNRLRRTEDLDHLGHAYRLLGRADLAADHHREGLEVARSMQTRVQEGYLLASLARDALRNEPLEAADELGHMALGIARELAHARLSFLSQAVLARVAARRDDRRATGVAWRALGRIDPRELRYHDRLQLNLVLGRSALRLGRPVDAEREARAGLAAAEPGGFHEFSWRFRALLGEALEQSQLPDEAAAAYNASSRLIITIASEIGDPGVKDDYLNDPARRALIRRAGDAEGSAPAPPSRPSKPGAAPLSEPATAARRTTGTGSAGTASTPGSALPSGASPASPTGRAPSTPGTPVAAGAAPGASAGRAPQTSGVPAAGAPSRTLETLHEITRAITSVLDLKELLNKVMDLALELVGAERGLVFLYRSETDDMDLVVARNVEGQTIRDATQFSRNIVQEAGRGRSLLSHDAVTDERFRDFHSVADYQIRSLLCVPLMLQARVIGTVYVDTRQPGVVFTDDHLRFLETFAGQAAIAIENARLYDQMRQENQYLKQAVQERYGYENIIGRSAPMRQVFHLLSRVAPSSLPVMIRGESGTGKELVARAVHHNSSRRDAKFYSENCAALPDTLLESELFGHAKGAFTGADTARKGLFELADGGTLFLDEVGDMSMTMQSKLLRVLQDGDIRPLGSETSRHVDVRVLSATNRDLEAMVKQKTFREDLYFRLNVIAVPLPALRDRRDDIPLLVDHFLTDVARDNNTSKLRVDPALMALMMRYDWPGNVRQLANQLAKLALFASGGTLSLTDARHDPEFFARATASTGTRGVDVGIGKEAILAALAKSRGSREEAARLLGISRATLFRKLRSLDIEPARKKRQARKEPRAER